MRQTFSEYGYLIIAAIVVALLIVLASPVNAWIDSALTAFLKLGNDLK